MKFFHKNFFVSCKMMNTYANLKWSLIFLKKKKKEEGYEKKEKRRRQAKGERKGGGEGRRKTGRGVAWKWQRWKKEQSPEKEKRWEGKEERKSQNTQQIINFSFLLNHSSTHSNNVNNKDGEGERGEEP